MYISYSLNVIRFVNSIDYVNVSNELQLSTKILHTSIFLGIILCFVLHMSFHLPLSFD